MKQFNLILLLVSLFMAGVVNAEQVTLSELEIPQLKMKLSNDGTGIIRQVSCGDCNYKFGKITKNTQAYVNGTRVDLFLVRKRAGLPIFIKYVRSTGEVMEIHWSEKS